MTFFGCNKFIKTIILFAKIFFYSLIFCCFRKKRKIFFIFMLFIYLFRYNELSMFFFYFFSLFILLFTLSFHFSIIVFNLNFKSNIWKIHVLNKYSNLCYFNFFFLFLFLLDEFSVDNIVLIVLFYVDVRFSLVFFFTFLFLVNNRIIIKHKNRKHYSFNCSFQMLIFVVVTRYLRSRFNDCSKIKNSIR